jgi:hypothetical protein
MPFLQKIFKNEVLESMFELFEIISTVKPTYDFVLKSSANERGGSPLILFSEIFKVLIS